MKAKLTVSFIKDFVPDPDRDVIIWDEDLTGFACRVTPKGSKTFFAEGRIGSLRDADGKRPKRRIKIGSLGKFTADQARREAKTILRKLESGIDPIAEEEDAEDAAKAALAAETARQKRIFSAVVERYIEEAVRNTRTAKAIESIIRRRLLPEWKDRDIATISLLEVSAFVDAIAESGQHSAAVKTLRSVISPLFSWALGKGLVKHNPATGVRIDVAETRRERTLEDSELREIWHDTDKLGHPFGAWIKILTLTGLRRTEAAAAEWSEIDLDKAEWVIPAARMKNGKEFLLPLTAPAVEILKAIPKELKFVFTSAIPRKSRVAAKTPREAAPISGFSKVKARLDRLILDSRKEAAAEAGEDASSVKAMAAWTYHDLRRTFRTGLAALRVLPHIAELTIAHTPPELRGIGGTYDRHKYAAEKRAALDLWAAHVTNICAANQPTNM